MKNEHKIDPISIHEDGENEKRKTGNLRGALEWGMRPLERDLFQQTIFLFCDIFRLRYFFCFLARLIHYL